MAGQMRPPLRRVVDAHGHSWRIGTDAEVAWIADGTSPSLAVTAVIPPVFAALTRQQSDHAPFPLA